MCDEDDVREYADGEATKVHVRRLLEWLARIRGDRARRLPALDVNITVDTYILLCFERLSTHYGHTVASLPILTFSPNCDIGTRFTTAVGQRAGRAVCSGNGATVVAHWFECLGDRFPGKLCKYSVIRL